MSETMYPQAPKDLPFDVTKASASFKKGVRGMVISLFIYLVIYLLLLACGIALAIILAICGGLAIYAVHNLFVIVLGAGLIVAGLLVLYFMVKFIFENKKADRSAYTELFEQDQPLLFGFIRKLSQETGTQFPKHIYLSQEVNAAVFYDSNFLSMFLPVRKNLVVGAGLINMLNLSEFKAVIAHEFGHFSQKSMKAGSYVYQANRVIYNMLYENEGYGQIIVKFANIHSAFAICARLTITIVHGIQWVQQQAYSLVNKQYSALSREMEFHADAVAAMASGSNNITNALHRIDFASSCFSGVLHRYDAWVSESRKGGNLFAHQRIMAAQIAAELRIPLQNGLPLLHENKGCYEKNNKVSIENPWASHPTIQQREQALALLGATGEVVDESAWALFNNVERIQTQLTQDLYKNIKFTKPTETAGDDAFAEITRETRAHHIFPVVYGQFYKGRQLSKINIDDLAPRSPGINDIATFIAEKELLVGEKNAAGEDIGLLGYIDQNKKHIRSFNYEGNKTKSNRAAQLKTEREAELKNVETQLQAADESVYLYFMQKAGQQSEAEANELKTYYRCYYKLQDAVNDSVAACNTVLVLLKSVFAGALVTQKISSDLESARLQIKDKIDGMITTLEKDAAVFGFVMPPEVMLLRNERMAFNESDETVTAGINNLNKLVHNYGNCCYNFGQKTLKAILDKQLAYL